MKASLASELTALHWRVYIWGVGGRIIIEKTAHATSDRPAGANGAAELPSRNVSTPDPIDTTFSDIKTEKDFTKLDEERPEKTEEVLSAPADRQRNVADPSMKIHAVGPRASILSQVTSPVKTGQDGALPIRDSVSPTETPDPSGHAAPASYGSTLDQMLDAALAARFDQNGRSQSMDNASVCPSLDGSLPSLFDVASVKEEPVGDDYDAWNESGVEGLDLLGVEDSADWSAYTEKHAVDSHLDKNDVS